MEYVVYRCDKIGYMKPINYASEIEVSKHQTFDLAAAEANKLKRSDKNHSYTVGCC